ncbi:MAG: glycosyltransferase family 4 protein, partial [Chloroflexi bacterium]|nr:glycosyltransferase family 4 protein [Chloroflexota bacterium]
HGIETSVLVPGFVPAAEQPLWYNAASLFVYPSLYEGFGLPPLEALACGTPVVVSNAASLPEVVGQAGLLVDPLDEHGLAEAIRRGLGDEEWRTTMSEAGPVQAASFSWQRMARQTLAVYDDLLSER